MQPRVTYFDNWNTLEQACLASAVRLLGDCETNWSIVCNHLKTKLCSIERPENWLTPESCEAQYKWLSDKYVKMEISCERPVNQILQNLKQIGECESLPVSEQERKYKDLKQRLESFAKNEIEPEIIMEYYEEACKKNRDREESLKKLGLKTDSPGRTKSLKPDNKTDGCSPLTTSPLLSSLLNNPPAVQYRPTLSTGSFIPSKSTQGTSRMSYEKAHTSDSNLNLGSQLSPLNEQSNSFSNSNASTARKLDFQDPSTSSATSNDHHSIIAKECHKDVESNNEPAIKSNIHNLENIPLIPATEEYLSETDMLLQVIDNLEGKQLLDKVLDELTSDKESTIDKTPRDTVNIPIDGSFVTDSPSSKITAQTVNLIPQSKSAGIVDSPLVNAKFVNPNNQYAVPNDVIIIEEETESKQVSDGIQITSIEQPALIETVTVNTDSSFSSLAVSVDSESISELKPDSGSVVEYLDASVIEKINKNEQVEESILIENDIVPKSVISAEDIRNENEKLEVSVDAHERPCSAPEDKEMRDTSVTDKSQLSVKRQIVETSLKAEEISSSTIKPEVVSEKGNTEGSEIKEWKIVCEVSSTTNPKDSSNSKQTPVDESEPICESKKVDIIMSEADHNINMKDEMKLEGCDKTEEPLAETETSSIISQPILDVSQTVSTNISSQELPSILEEPNSTPIEERALDVKLSSSTEVIKEKEDVSVKVGTNKNKRSFPRKRKSTAPESTVPPKIPKMIEVIQSFEVEKLDLKRSAVPKDTNITMKDSQIERLDSEIAEGLFKPKEEPGEDTPIQPAQIPAKIQAVHETSVNKIVDSKKTKLKAISNRRSSIRSQNQNSSSPKTEDVLTPPSTPSSSKTNDSASTKKKSLALAHSRLVAHKYSSAFLRPISNKTVVGYEDVIYNPLDLQTIKRKIDNKVIATVTDFQRDVLFMILNAKMFNQINSQVYNMAVEIQKEALRDIQLTVKTLGEGVIFEMEDDVSEKVRKRQSVENVKKDQKQNKRSKLFTKEESISMKKVKVEENESIS